MLDHIVDASVWRTLGSYLFVVFGAGGCFCFVFEVAAYLSRLSCLAEAGRFVLSLSSSSTCLAWCSTDEFAIILPWQKSHSRKGNKPVKGAKGSIFCKHQSCALGIAYLTLCKAPNLEKLGLNSSKSPKEHHYLQSPCSKLSKVEGDRPGL